ncbi:hypothetical protein Tco_0772882 [Tanacetum coccineum]|uniref:Reverse transcriptase domain-containing protein n=1 Tax=Tanacetum coccineum TaxID=301880 RepID=A0ABQ4ZKG0_9ASTR
MAELHPGSHRGYEDAIVVPEIDVEAAILRSSMGGIFLDKRLADAHASSRASPKFVTPEAKDIVRALLLDKLNIYSSSAPLRKSELSKGVTLPGRTFSFEVSLIVNPYHTSNHAIMFEVRKELKICEAKTDETSIDEPPESGVEVDRAKIDVIAKLPHPTTIKVFGERHEKIIGLLHYASKTNDMRRDCSDGVLLLQEFDFDVVDTKGAENLAADHLSRLENPHKNELDPKEINEKFPLETLSSIAVS